MHVFHVYQAGKIEETNDTILALCSDEIQYSIRIPSNLKQEIYYCCSKKHKKNLTIRMFAHGLNIILKNFISQDTRIIVDKEYDGHEKDIKGILISRYKIPKDILFFDVLGKKDLSHRIANQIFSGKLKPNYIVTKKEFNIGLILSQKIQDKFKKKDA